MTEAVRASETSVCFNENHIPRPDDALRTSETSANLYETSRRYIPEGCYLHARRRENLNSHNSVNVRNLDLCRFSVSLGQVSAFVRVLVFLLR
jgi:hypothetical protein